MTRNLNVLIVFVMFLFTSATSPAQETATTPNQESDHESFDRLDEKILSAIDDRRIIGCAGLVIHKGKEIFADQWGKLDRDAGTQLKRDAIYRIYSMSKPITSVAVMQLVEAGKIDLDTPLSKYLPGFANPKVLKSNEEVNAKREITTRDLLRHTSGLTYGFFGNTEVDKRYRSAGILMIGANIEQTVKKLSGIPLLYQPGVKWHYSVSTDVLGRLVEVVSGKMFDVYLNDHIFEPLGMDDTFFHLPKEKLHRLAEMYQPNDRGKLVPCPGWDSFRIKNPKNRFFSGGGGLCSTIDDYTLFARMLLNKGKLDDKQIISTETFAEMTKNQLTDSGDFQFGLGLRITNRGDMGWGGAAGTNFWINPKHDLIVVYMTQLKPYNGRDFSHALLEAAHESIK